MTREHEITIASCAYGSRGSSIDFEAGAKWADANPKSGLIDLSQVWHDASEEPEKGKLMIGVDEDGISIYNRWVGQDGDDWFSFSEDNRLIRWAYIEDLLLKGDKK